MASKKTKTINNNIWIIRIIGFIIVIVFLILIMSHSKKNSLIYQNTIITQPEATTISQTINSTNKYHSDFMKITIDIPRNFEIEDTHSDISVKNKKSTREITISSIGTNYETIEGYLEYLSKKNKVSIIDRLHVSINNLNGIKGAIKHLGSNNPDTYIYFFYPEPWTIISISTNSPELYSDLDQIARSFRYEP